MSSKKEAADMSELHQRISPDSWWSFCKAVHLVRLLCTPGDQRPPRSCRLVGEYHTQVSSSLDTLTGTDLEPAREDFQMALNLFVQGQRVQARAGFAAACSLAESVLKTSKVIQTQIEAVRLATVCSLYESGDNIEQAEAAVILLMQALHDQAGVRQTFSARIGTSLVNRVIAKFKGNKRENIMRQLCIMNFVLCNYFLSQGMLKNLDSWPGVAVSGKRTVHPMVFALQMTDVAQGMLLVGPGDEEQTGDASLRTFILASDTTVVSYGKHRYSIEAWSPQTLQHDATFVDNFAQSTSLAMCHGSNLYVAKNESHNMGGNLTISAFNTATKKPINVFFMVEGECVHLLCGGKEGHTSVMVVTDDGVVHRSGAACFDRVSRVMSFDIDNRLSRQNSAATLTRLIYTSSGTIHVHDIDSGKPVIDVTSACWQFPIAAGNCLCTFAVSSTGLITGVEARRADDMNLIFSHTLSEQASIVAGDALPVIGIDVADNLLLLVVERMVSVWDLVSGSQLTAIAFDMPNQFRGYRPSSACFFRKEYIFVATLSGSVFRFAICD